MDEGKRKAVWEGAFEHYVHPKKDQLICGSSGIRKFPRHNSRVSFRSCGNSFRDAFTCINAAERVTKLREGEGCEQEPSFNSSFVARCAVTGLKWNKGAQAA
jgi:hypothetical protein